MGENKKIKNATPTITDNGIQMKSKTEVMIYKALRELGFNPEYEGETFTYWDGGYPKTDFYDMHTNRNKPEFYRHLRHNAKKLIAMRYTPDFIFMYENIKVIIEVKGWENDQFAIRKKLFRKYLDTLPYPVVYAEIFTKRQLLEFIKNLEENKEEIKRKKTMVRIRAKATGKAVKYTGNNLAELVETFEMDDYVHRTYGTFEKFQEEVNKNGYAEVQTDSIFHIPTFVVDNDKWVVLIEDTPYVLNDEEFNNLFEII